MFHNGIDDFRRTLGPENDNGGMGIEAGIHHSGQAVAVKHGQYAEHLVFRLKDDAGNKLLPIAHQVSMGEHSPLRAAGSAGGVHQGTYVILGDIFRKLRCFGAGIPGSLEIQVMDINRRTGYFQSRIGDQKFGARISDNVVHFPVHQGIIHRNNDGSQTHHSQIHIHKFRPV